MNPPREDAITEALAVLGAVASPDQLAVGAAALADGMGLPRYIILDVRGGMIGGLYHNAPASLHSDLASLQSVNDDRISARARASRIPFAWQCEEGTWRHRCADLGYRSGVASGWFDQTGTGCVVVMSCTEPDVPTEHGEVLLTYALMASMQLSTPLRQFALPEFDCPFTERELDCLLYALAGKSMKETARALKIGSRTVEDYLSRARLRLGVHTSYAAATIALRRGWLDMQQASELAGLGPAAGAGHVG